MSVRWMLAVVILGAVSLSADDPPPAANRAGDPPAEQRSAPKQKQQSAPQQEDSKENDFDFWMDKKLEYSQDILRGLTTDDLDLVAAKARQMRLLSKVEGWVRRGTPGYAAQLQAFEFAGMEVERNAKSGNLQAAALGFHRLTTSCVSCHAFLRDPPR